MGRAKLEQLAILDVKVAGLPIFSTPPPNNSTAEDKGNLGDRNYLYSRQVLSDSSDPEDSNCDGDNADGPGGERGRGG